MLKCYKSLVGDTSLCFFMFFQLMSVKLLRAARTYWHDLIWPCQVPCKFVCDNPGQVCFCGHLKLGTADSNADARAWVSRLVDKVSFNSLPSLANPFKVVTNFPNNQPQIWGLELKRWEWDIPSDIVLMYLFPSARIRTGRKSPLDRQVLFENVKSQTRQRIQR